MPLYLAPKYELLLIFIYAVGFSRAPYKLNLFVTRYFTEQNDPRNYERVPKAMIILRDVLRGRGEIQKWVMKDENTLSRNLQHIPVVHSYTQIVSKRRIHAPSQEVTIRNYPPTQPHLIDKPLMPIKSLASCSRQQVQEGSLEPLAKIVHMLNSHSRIH